MTRYILWAFLLMAVGLAGLALCSFLFPAPDLPAFVVPSTERDLENQLVGRSVLTFDITNQSDLPRRILGLAEG